MKFWINLSKKSHFWKKETKDDHAVNLTVINIILGQYDCKFLLISDSCKFLQKN